MSRRENEKNDRENNLMDFFPTQATSLFTLKAPWAVFVLII